jgi:hypothetical protein
MPVPQHYQPVRRYQEEGMTSISRLILCGVLLVLVSLQGAGAAPTVRRDAIDYDVEGSVVGADALQPASQAVTVSAANGGTVRCRAWGWSENWASIHVGLALLDSANNVLASDEKSQYPAHTVTVTFEHQVSQAGTYYCNASFMIEGQPISAGVPVTVN